MHRFRVQGSTEIYDVSIMKDGDNLTSLCNCQAGQNQMSCKHRLNIFLGIDTDVIDNKIAVKLIPDFIKDTAEATLMEDIVQLEKNIENLTKEFKNKKKLLGKLLVI